jgi:glycosyltransferase involved in cell wall biosynthesis
MKKIISSRFRIKSNNILFEGGNRLQKKEKKIKKDSPIITIITVVKNNEKYLEETIKSVLNQKYNNLEYIIIDGASEDKSINIIKKYINKIDYAISQKDKNLWDAINKGLSLATGDLIGIVNSDDTLTPSAFKLLNKYYFKYPNSDFFFGSVKKHWGILHGYRPWKIKYTWFFYSSHSTGFFIKKKAANIVGKYSLKYCSSDFDYFFRMIVKHKLLGVSSKKNELFGHFRRGGISSKIEYWDHFYEKNQIRVDNNQNKIFIFILMILKIILSYKRFNTFKFKSYYRFIKKNI